MENLSAQISKYTTPKHRNNNHITFSNGQRVFVIHFNTYY